jgi:hypothetical protein
MKRWYRGRKGRLGALAGAVLVAAVVGAIVVFALPGGAENKVSLNGPGGTVECGASVPVTVDLDDLEARPSPNKQGVNYGLNAFALWISFDPDILRIQSQGDVVLNTELNQADPDGVFPNFAPYATFIDSYSGTLTYAAGSVVIDPVTNLGEEGPDPVAAGHSIQLFCITFLANNTGTSPVTITSVDLGDPGTQPYEPVTVTNTSVTVSGGTCPNLPRPTPTSTPPVTPTATLTPAATSTGPELTPTPTAEGAGEGSRPVTPVLASEGGRPDCPAGWYVYKDPDGHYSVCYVAPLSARSERLPQGPVIAYFSTPLGKWPAEPAVNYVSIAINVLLPGWKVDTSCAAASLGGPAVDAGTLALSGTEARICQVQGPTEDAGYAPLQAVVPVSPDGTSLLIFAFKTGPDVSAGADLIQAVLRTIAPGPVK